MIEFFELLCAVLITALILTVVREFFLENPWADLYFFVERLQKTQMNEFKSNPEIALSRALKSNVPSGIKVWFFTNDALELQCTYYQEDDYRGFELYTPHLSYGAKFEKNKMLVVVFNNCEFYTEHENRLHMRTREAIATTIALVHKLSITFEGVTI